MIYVRRDGGLIPADLLKDAEEAQQKLESLPASERCAFIKSKASVWQAFGKYLAQMSFDKCWYTESPAAQAFFEVDHFRPKLSAKRSSDKTDPGYAWLAFSWENFRWSAPRTNRRSRDEDSEEVVGKGAWFPLLQGSPQASWDDRCVDRELPVLLDPVNREDVDLIDVMPDGRMGPSELCVGSSILRVEQSIEVFGLNLPRLKTQRARVIREVNYACEALFRALEVAKLHVPAADHLQVARLFEPLRQRTRPSSPFAKAARAQLRLHGFSQLCAGPEDG